MLDPQEQQRLDGVILQNSKNAEKYLQAREQSARAKFSLDVLVGAKYLSKEISPGMAHEKAIILVANENEENKNLYKDLIQYTASYKGLEKVIEANEEQIRWAQSKMKYIKENT